MSSTGERIKKLRRARGMTQVQLADRAGASSQVISNMERSYTADLIRPELITSLASALGTTVDYLLCSSPYSAAPASKQEEELLLNFRKLDPRRQSLVSELLRDLAMIPGEEA